MDPTNLKCAFDYAVSLRGAEDCFADRCCVTLAQEVERLRCELSAITETFNAVAIATEGDQFQQPTR